MVIRLHYLGYLLLVLILLGYESSGASTTIKVDFQPNIDEENHNGFFHRPNKWSSIYTDREDLPITGEISDKQIGFLLLSLGGKSFPITVVNGRFASNLKLAPGNNQLIISSNNLEVKPLNLEIVRVVPATIESIQAGAQSYRLDPIELNDIPTANTEFSSQVQSPQIIIKGSMGTKDFVQLRVKDNYNNTLPVYPVGAGKFQIQYTLRENESNLRFLSFAENQLIKTSTLEVSLGDIIHHDFLSQENPKEWILYSGNHSYPIAQKDTVFIRGQILALKEGSLEIILGDESMIIPVKDHKFGINIPLIRNQLNAGRIKANIDGQSFFESFRIEQKEPKVELTTFKRSTVDGSHLMPGRSLNISTEALQLEEGHLQLAGISQFLGGLNLVAIRSPDQKRYLISDKPGSFDFQVPMELGNYSYTLALEAGDFVRPYFSFEVEVGKAIQLDSVNYLPIKKSAPTISLSKPELLLKGKVSGVSRGILKLTVADETYQIPVLQNSFEMDKPILIDETIGEIKFHLSGKNTLFERSYQLEHTYSEQLPETDA